MRIIKYILIIIFSTNLFANEIVFTKSEEEYLRNHPTIKVSNEKDWPPLDYMLNGKPMGYSIDLLNLISKKLNIKIEYVNNLDCNELLEAFQKGEIDLFHSLYKSKERSNYAIFSKPYYINNSAVFSNISEQLNSLKDLEGKTVAMPKGYAMFEFLEENIKNLKILEVNSLDEAIWAVASKKADYIVDSAVIIQEIIIREAIPNIKLSFMPKFPNVDKETFAVRFATLKNNPTLLSIIQKAYDSLSFEEKRKLQLKWFGLVQKNTNTPMVELTKKEKEFIKKHPQILVQNEMDYPPYDFVENGKPTGYSIEYLRLLEQKTGLTFKFINNLAWAKLIQYAKEHKIDMMHTLIKDEERTTFLDFSKPYVKDYYGLIVPSGSKIQSFDDLKGEKIAILKNDAGSKKIKENKNIHVVEYDHTIDILKDVIQGKIKAAILGIATANYLAKKTMLPAIEYRYLNSLDNFFQPLHIGTRKDWPELLSIIEKGMSSITNHELLELRDKWLGEVKTSNNQVELTQKQLDFLNSKETLRICIAPNRMPFSGIDKNSKQDGMSYEYTKLISEKIGKKIELYNTKTWTESLKSIKSKKCDILSFVKKTRKNNEYLNFTQSFLSIPYVIVAKNDKFFIDNFNDIKDKKFAAVKDYSVIEDLKKRYPNINIVAVNDIQEGLEKVDNAEVYGYIDATSAIVYAMEKYRITDVKIVGKLPINYDFAFGIHKEDKQLLQIINNVINSIDANERSRIYKKWAAVKGEVVIDYSLVWKVIIAAFVLLLLFGYWNRKIVKAHKLLEEAKKEIEKKNSELEKLAITDKLTGLYNRAKLDELLHDELNRCKRFNHTLGVSFLDIDYFKKINDTYGHQIGDKILVEISQLLKKHTRKTDFIGRWGGEEFLIISPESDEKGFLQLIETLRAKIESYVFSSIGQTTASFGVTMYKNSDSLDNIIKRVDDGLYKAKESGRNKIVLID